MLLNKYMVGLALGLSVTVFAASTASATTNAKVSDHKVGICHATGSAKNPYVYIVVDKHAVKAHTKHHEGKDIVGVSSADKCPKPAVKGTTAPTATPAPGKGSTLGAAAPAVEAAPTTLPSVGSSAGLSAMLGIPALYLVGRAYLRSRQW